jgi:arylsulfatase A-like enzyme
MLEYVDFYAYLHRRSDRDMGTVLDAPEANRDLLDRTILIRLSDHGEMGLAHGGMREKGYNAHEETMHVPLVISDPALFPRPVRTDALASLVDLMPTLATLADVPHRGEWTLRGRDLTPVIRDAVAHPRRPTATVQDSILSTTDETIGFNPDARPHVITQPAHVRCIREEHWKYAMYFDPDHVAEPQYELYDLRADPLGLHDMAAPESPYHDAAKSAEMQAKLQLKMEQTGTVPY